MFSQRCQDGARGPRDSVPLPSAPAHAPSCSRTPSTREQRHGRGEKGDEKGANAAKGERFVLSLPSLRGAPCRNNTNQAASQPASQPANQPTNQPDKRWFKREKGEAGRKKDKEERQQRKGRKGEKKRRERGEKAKGRKGWNGQAEAVAIFPRRCCSDVSSASAPRTSWPDTALPNKAFTSDSGSYENFL